MLAMYHLLLVACISRPHHLPLVHIAQNQAWPCPRTLDLARQAGSPLAPMHHAATKQTISPLLK